MEIIREIADNVDEIIQFTVDFPAKHKDKKLAILDINASVNKEKQNRIDLEFYEKTTKNKFVILNSSAISSQQKRTILTQECLRRLRNTKIELGRDVQNKYLNDFMFKLKKSGYNVQYRKQILGSALNAFQKMIRV